MIQLDALVPRWPALSVLLDEALALPVTERAGWLQALKGERAELRDTLRELLAARADVETGAFLGTMPRLPAIPGGGAAGVATLAAGDRVGPYRLKATLGRGGMGTVWRAERADGAFEREVALKLPLINRLRQDLAARFARERDILARLEHVNIARFCDAGVTADGLPYLAMEFVDGQAIGAYCDTRQLDVPARLHLFSQVLDAVQYAHANLVVHRDLKPSNILVTADGQVRLLDFGIAKLLAGDGPAHETELTQSAGRALTPDYASPEQIKGEPLTIASDIYSLGVVLYELLVGRRPYRLAIESAAQMEAAIVSADPLRPSSVVGNDAAHARGATTRRLARTLAGDLDTIVLKALAKAPTQRYATIAELAADVQRHLRGLPILARPDSWLYRARKFVLRRRLESAIAAAVVVALLGGAYAQVAVMLALALGSGVALWQARSARQQARRAQAQARRAEEVKKFVLSIFADANPDGGEGHQVSAVELLGQARQRLADSPVADAATMVELQTAIGKGLVAIGEHQLAFDVMKQAVDLVAARLPEAHPQSAAARLQLAFTAIDVGELPLAETQLGAAERGMRRLGDMAGVADVLCARSEMRRDQGDNDAALAMADQAVQVAEAHAGRSGDPRPLIEALMVLVEIMLYVHREGALEPARRARDLARAAYGDRPHDRALEARRSHALAQVWEGDAPAGLAELKEILAQRLRLTGELHHSVSSLHLSIGLGAESLGDVASAIDAFREVLRLTLARSHGKPFAGAANAQYNVGVFLAGARRFDEALAELQQSDTMYAALQADHPMRCLTGSAIAMVLTELDRHDEADPIYPTLVPSDDYDQAMISVRLGTLRSAQGRHAEALALLRAGADYFTQQALPRRLAPALLRLGTALLMDRQAAPALEVFEQARAMMAPAHTQGSPDLADTLLGLARARLALGHAEQASANAQAAAAFWQSFDPANRHAGLAHLWSARTSIAVELPARAEVELEQSAAVLRHAAQPSDHSLLRQVQAELAAATAGTSHGLGLGHQDARIAPQQAACRMP